MQPVDNQGEKFKTFLKELVKSKTVKYEGEFINMETAAKMLGYSKQNLYSKFKSKRLDYDSVKNILNTFNITEDELWGVLKNSKPNAKPVTFSNTEPNMWIVPIKAQGGFLGGYGDQVYLESFLKKVAFPFIKGECFAFEIEGESMLTDFVPRNYFIGSTIEDKNFLVKGRPYVFQTIDGIIIKCFDYFDDEFMYLYSLNQEFNPVVPIPLKNIKKIYQKEGYLEL